MMASCSPDQDAMRDINSKPSYRIGLRRLWLVISVIWILGAGAVNIQNTSWIHDCFWYVLMPVVFLYALMAGINWVIEGFRSDR
jgi:hypothetical protein